jgi:Reverse transcriptase (RNA-dependent DNA polymerase)
MRIYSYFKENDFKQCLFGHVIYVKEIKDEFLIIALYVIDLNFIGNCQMLIDEFKKIIKFEFEIADLKMMKYFLDLKIK